MSNSRLTEEIDLLRDLGGAKHLTTFEIPIRYLAKDFVTYVCSYLCDIQTLSLVIRGDLHDDLKMRPPIYTWEVCLALCHVTIAP